MGTPLKNLAMIRIRKAVTFLSLGLVCSLLAEDIALNDGRVLTNATVTGADPLAVVIAHQGGIDTIPFELCPLDVQALHGYSPSKAEAERERRAKEEAEVPKAEAEAPKETNPPQQDTAALAALRALQYEKSFSEKMSQVKPKPRLVGAVAFGVQLGHTFQSQGVPLAKVGSVEYHPIAEVPVPSELFAQYLLLVSNNNKRVIGVEARGFRGGAVEFSKLTDLLTRAYGRYDDRSKGINQEFSWRDGQMEIVLERSRLGISLTFRVPH